MAAAGRGEHAADPGAEREADDGERVALVRAIGMVYLFVVFGVFLLLVVLGDAEYLRVGSLTYRVDAGGAGRHREHVARVLGAVTAALGERLGQHVVLLGHLG